MALTTFGGCPTTTHDGDDEPGPTPTLELGFFDSAANVYSPVAEGGDMPLFRGFQGASHIFVTLRITGFPAGGDGTVRASVETNITMNGGARVLSDTSQTATFTLIGDGTFEVQSFFVFLNAVTEDADDQAVVATFSLTSESDADTRAELTQSFVLRNDE